MTPLRLDHVVIRRPSSSTPPLRGAGVELTATGIVPDLHRIPYYSREPMAHENRLLEAKLGIIFSFATFFVHFFQARPKQKKLSLKRENFSANGQVPTMVVSHRRAMPSGE